MEYDFIAPPFIDLEVEPGALSAPGIYRTLTTSVTYWRPDHPLLLQEFFWQSHDVAPNFPRIRRFLNYWQRHIDGPIQRVQVLTQRVFPRTQWRLKDLPRHRLKGLVNETRSTRH